MSMHSAADLAGRPPALVALRERDGLTPPPGVELVGWALVPAGSLYQALESKEV